MAPKFWPTTLFPRNFHTPNIRTDIEKQNKSIYYSNKFQHIQCEKCTTPSVIEHSRLHHIWIHDFVLEYSRPYVVECSRS